MRQNITINGQGNVPSGEYDEITISGYGRIEDATTANSITINAFGSIGDVTSSIIKVNGCGKFTGSVEAKEISLSGKINFMKEVKADSVKCFGLLNIENDVFITDFFIKGTIKTNSSVFCESFMLESNNSTLSSVEGKSVIVRPAKISLFKHRSKCNYISANAVDVANVDVRSIHGDNVVIGANCTINEVFYQSSLIIDPSSVVRNKTQTLFTSNDKSFE